ncbi:hypothetical protein ADK34_32175 [Streptomyces viridochromogenes]|uniref:Uncharacterized protein n=1 Tax=Streptomyces viridochromogenes TaxID=1938 RepID=A0A0L8JFU5_STRVR|nr:hypothetical protein ADK34_32175 [Streptomyces viridochromogenes]
MGHTAGGAVKPESGAESESVPESVPEPVPGPVSAVRYALGVLGLLLIGIGGRHLASQPDPYDVLVWLGGALVLHDGVLAPLVLAVGLLVAAVPARRVVRGALVTGGALVLVTLPLLLRPGVPPNPSALPLPYARNLLLLLAVVTGVTVVWVGLTRLRWRGTPGVRDKRAMSSEVDSRAPEGREPDSQAPPEG